MKRGQWADDMARIRSASHDHTITRDELRAFGLSSSTIVERCLTDGPWQHLLPAIILLHNGIPTDRQRMIAALRYAGPGSMLTGTAGLGLHGQSVGSGTVSVLIAHQKRCKSTRFVDIERTRRLPDPVELTGLPVAPATRCVIDAARRAHDGRSVLDLMTSAIRRGITTVDELAIELSECTTRGTAIPRRELRRLGSGAHSVAEQTAHDLYSAHDMPPIQFNRDIVDADGHFLARPDGWMDDVALAWEIDSFAHHLAPADHEKTMARRSKMQSHGIVVVSHLPKTIRDCPGLVITELRAAYRTASARPRPAVHIRSEPGAP
jgi:hypothetical protein